MATSAQEIMFSLFAASTDPEIIRRGWLRAMMQRFDAPFGSCHNAGFDPVTRNITVMDVFSEGPETWRSVATLIDGMTIADLDVNVGNLSSMNKFDRFLQGDLPAVIHDIFWKPCDVTSSLMMNILDDGRFAGFISLYRTHDATAQFDGREMRGEARSWERSSVKLLSVTHAMLAKGPKKRGVMLFKPDGTPWLQNRLDVDWADERFESLIRDNVRAFAKGGEQEVELHLQNTRLNLSALRGGGEEAILLVVEPMLIPDVPELLKLSRMQRLVASYLASGATIDEIAQLLSRSSGTIKTHIQTIYARLGICSRAELAILYDSALEWKGGD